VSFDTEPVVRHWYRDVETDEMFLVVAIDEDEGFIEIRTADNELDEIDLDVWHEMDLEESEEPEDWREEDDDDEDWDDEDEDEDEDEDDDDYDDEDEEEDDDDRY
jgi:hypothetical protein